jgi:hypothetical protein
MYLTLIFNSMCFKYPKNYSTASLRSREAKQLHGDYLQDSLFATTWLEVVGYFDKHCTLLC